MDLFDLAAKITLDTSELGSELDFVRVGLQTTKSELNAVRTAFIGAERSTKALSAENDVLKKYSYDLNDQLRIQQQLLQKATEEYGVAAVQTQKYQQQVNNTTAELNKANAAIKQNEDQIRRNEAQSSGLNGVLGKLGLNVGEVAQKFGISTGAANSLTSALGSAAAGYAAVAAAAIKAIGAMNDFSKAQAAHIDDINTLARNYHMTAEQIQNFDYMSKLIDVDTRTITGSISRLTRTMASAKEGTGDAADAFARLGVRVTNTDGLLRDSTAVFYDTIDAIKRISSETEQDAIAMEIFGRSAMDLRGVIDAGSAGLRAYSEEANQLGVVLSGEANRRLQSLQDEADRVDAVQNSLKQNWATLWAPAAEFFEGVQGGFALVANAGVKSLLELASSADSAANSFNALNAAAAGWRDLNPADSLDLLPTKRAEYVKYLRQANETQSKLGYKIGIASYENWERGYDAAHPVQTKISVQLDGRELAQASYGYMQSESALRGGAIR